MTSEKHFLKQYLNTVVELSNETGMSKKEARDVLDIALSKESPASVNFNEIKTELKTFITINLFSLLCKL
tara:strand:- start:5881 stop:6090 length:210 start_codon:yes stop_codon:yes gene_type:complete